MPKRIRAVAIVLKDGKVLLMHRWKNEKEYYVFPGGGVEADESVEDAVTREIREETTLEIEVGKLLYHHIYDDGSEQYFYLCRYVSGEPQPGDGPEYTNPDPNNRFQPEWVDVGVLPKLLLYPLEIRDWFLHDLVDDFLSAPREATLKIAEVRQSL